MEESCCLLYREDARDTLEAFSRTSISFCYFCKENGVVAGICEHNLSFITRFYYSDELKIGICGAPIERDEVVAKLPAAARWRKYLLDIPRVSDPTMLKKAAEITDGRTRVSTTIHTAMMQAFGMRLQPAKRPPKQDAPVK
jgi:hypothetical protein